MNHIKLEFPPELSEPNSKPLEGRNPLPEDSSEFEP